MTTKKQTVSKLFSDDLLRPVLLALLGWLCLQAIEQGNAIASMEQQLVSLKEMVSSLRK